MTEIAAAAIAGQIVSHAGKAIAEEEKSTKKELLVKAKETPEFAEAARQLAKRIAIRQEIVTNCYKPIAKLFGVANHYFDNDFENELAEKLADVPEEHIVAPKASLAAPAMLQLGFSLDEAELKEMYLNLLATASDDRRSSSAHPSFVEVIKQLSVDEIAVLNRILTTPGSHTPIVALKLVTVGEEGWNNLAKHIIEDVDGSAGAPVVRPNLATYGDNWIRLGLVEVSYTNFVTRAGAYDWVDQRPEMVAWKAALAQKEGATVEFDKGSINPTSFGKSFAKVVGIMG
jgi:hypothetical protein